MWWLTFLSCTGDPILSMSGAPYCMDINAETGDYCAPITSCCDSRDDCWFVYDGVRYPCVSRGDCSDAIDRVLAESCDLR